MYILCTHAPPRNHKVDDFVCAFGGVVWGWGLHALEVRHLWFWGRAFILFSGGGVYGFEFEGRAFMGFVGVLMVFEGGFMVSLGGGGVYGFSGSLWLWSVGERVVLTLCRCVGVVGVWVGLG